MNKFTALSSRIVPLAAENVDTDQIIPARFLKVTDKNGLGASLFCDWRYLADGSPNPATSTPFSSPVRAWQFRDS